MEVPKGFLATLWSFLSFLPFFVLLLVLGVAKAAVIGPVASVIIVVGNSSVIIGMWPAHFIWTYFCVMKTKRLGLVFKLFLLVMLPVPLVLWPAFGILGSFLVGICYGSFAPLIATFEAVGEDVVDKLYHSFSDGCLDTINGSCTLVVDFTDFCFHSYFSYMDDLIENVSVGEKPMDVKLSELPSCVLVTLLAMLVDVPMISIVTLCKSPYMLVKGWNRLFHDLIGREGPFLETVCVPFAGLAIILWPLAVTGAVVAALLCSFLLALYGGVVVHQESSIRMGLAYIISVVSVFDEYTNDLLYMREGSCLPRPKYRKAQVDNELLERKNEVVQKIQNEKLQSEMNRTKLTSERSRIKKAIQQLKPIQVRSLSLLKYVKIYSYVCLSPISMEEGFLQIWDWLFSSCEISGRILLGEGLITVADIEECIVKGKNNKLRIKLPSWCILQCLLRSAKSDSYGLLISDEVELTNFNWPKDKVLDWILGPLLIMKEQIKKLQLNENEETCLRKLILTGTNEKPEDWDEEGFPSDDNVRKAQLQAVCRRLQGIVANMSRIPTFRRRFNSLVKSLYLGAIEAGALNGGNGGSATGSQIRVSDWRRKNKSLVKSRSLDV